MSCIFMLVQIKLFLLGKSTAEISDFDFNAITMATLASQYHPADHLKIWKRYLKTPLLKICFQEGIRTDPQALIS